MHQTNKTFYYIRRHQKRECVVELGDPGQWQLTDCVAAIHSRPPLTVDNAMVP